MTSPFPGMDPYLERHWGDVHSSLVIYARDQLQRKLPDGLRARVEERVFVESPGDGGRSIIPDVRVVEGGRAAKAATASAPEPGVAVAEPVLIVAADEPATQTYLVIIDARSGDRVITVMEFLSPSNKRPGDGRTLYLVKQQELMRGGVNSVEIDLVRDGVRTFSIPDRLLPDPHRRGYAACVRRARLTGQFEVYAFPLRERLPAIRIPLRHTDKDVALDLQTLVEQCYENGGYDTIDYRPEPHPPLAAEDAGWVDELLREKGRRA